MSVHVPVDDTLSLSSKALINKNVYRIPMLLKTCYIEIIVIFLFNEANRIATLDTSQMRCA